MTKPVAARACWNAAERALIASGWGGNNPSKVSPKSTLPIDSIRRRASDFPYHRREVSPLPSGHPDLGHENAHPAHENETGDDDNTHRSRRGEKAALVPAGPRGLRRIVRHQADVRTGVP